MNCPSLHPFLFFSLALHRSRSQRASAVVATCISRGCNLHRQTTLSCNPAAHPRYGSYNRDTQGGSLEYSRAYNLVSMYLVGNACVWGLVTGGNRQIEWGTPWSRETKSQGKGKGRGKKEGIPGENFFLYK